MRSGQDFNRSPKLSPWAAIEFDIFFVSTPITSPDLKTVPLPRSKNLAGAEGFEPPSSVLETDSLTVELTPLNSVVSDQSLVVSFLATDHWSLLFHFLVRLVLAAPGAELLELQALGGRL